MQEEIINSQCFYFPKMKKDAEIGYKIVDKMIWELFQYKGCATINCPPNTLKILNSWTKKQNKVIWNAIPTLFDVLNPPSKVTPSQPIKARSMRSTIKKTSVESTEQPVDILQDLPSTSKQSQVWHTTEKEIDVKDTDTENKTFEKTAIHKAKKQNCNWFIGGPVKTVLVSRDCEPHWKINNVISF